MFARLAVAGLAMLACGTTSQDRAPGVKRLVFVLEVDCDRAREVGWTGPDDRAILELAAKIVEKRFVAMERAARVEVVRDTGRFQVSLPSIDSRDRELFEEMLRSIGVCEFFWLADDELLAGLGTDLERERGKLDTWRKSNADAPLEAFNVLAPEQEGPHPRVLWGEAEFAAESGAKVRPPPHALLLPSRPDEHIGAGSFASSSLALDTYGYPAIAFELHESRSEDFARMTGSHLNRRLGIVLAGKLRSAPTLNSVLHGGGIIEGRFTQEECEAFAALLRKREGPLRVVEVR